MSEGPVLVENGTPPGCLGTRAAWPLCVAEVAGFEPAMGL